VKAESCWFSAYPILKPGDILYRPIQGELWRIVKKSSVGGQGVTLQQVCRISTINRSDVEYQKLPKTIPQAELLSVIRAWEETKQERLW
jgi:hypothetical protein